MGQNNKRQAWCPFPDCEKCPHSDCIKERIFRPIPKQEPRPALQQAEMKPGEKPPSKYSLLPEEEKQRRRQMAMQWQKDNRERYLAGKKKWRELHKEEIKAKKRKRLMQKIREEASQTYGKQHLSDGEKGQRPDAGASR